ncbi:MAG: hypothetical protein A2992_08760 [Elusimicrobia bacterium RIFCSPLOWO2_01_FULL_59_12]|nr:MAG: hypothetical protein A2992_08760 [Elusimicrobia bacterium RIFCSPLOWO2_01_FULL_59_12]
MTLWLNGRFLLLYGGNDPLRLSWPSFKTRVDELHLPETDAYDLLGFFVAEVSALTKWVAGAPLNTDDNMLIETRAPLLFDQLDSVETGSRSIASIGRWVTPVHAIIAGISAREAQKLSAIVRARTIFVDGIRVELEKDPRGAFELYEQAHTLNPVNYQFRSFLESRLVARAGQAYLARHFQEAERLLRKALAYIPTSRPANFLMAETLYDSGQHDRGLLVFGKLLKHYPHYYQGHLSLAERLLTSGRPADGLAHLEFVLNYVPNSRDALSLKTRITPSAWTVQ